MDKNKDIQVLSHNIQLIDRKTIQMNGIKKIESFNKEEFFLQSVMGYILIKGEELELMKLDTSGGNIYIKGKIDSITYIDDTKKKNKESLLSRLFK
jgi:sporulation protein YabP